MRLSRRCCLVAILPWLSAGALAQGPLVLAMRQAEALRDSARRLHTSDLAGCGLPSTSRPSRICEAAGGWAGISRMVYGASLIDAGAPQ